MTDSTDEKVRKARLKRSQEIADSVKKGEYTPAAFDKNESWFPQRPVIRKDKRALSVVHGEDDVPD